MSVVRRLQQWVTAPVESTLLQVPRALVVSVLALAVDGGLYVLLVEQLSVPPVLANVVSYLTGGVVQYVLCSVWVFPASPDNHAVGFIAFSVLSLVGLALSSAVIYVLYDLAHVNELLAKLASVGLAFMWNFLSRKYLLFKPASPTRTLPAATVEPNCEADVCAAPLCKV
jgi:putative flippase GtrA